MRRGVCLLGGCTLTIVLGGLLLLLLLISIALAGMLYVVPAPLASLILNWALRSAPPDSDAFGVAARVPFTGYQGPVSFACTLTGPGASLFRVSDCFGVVREGGIIHVGIDYGTPEGTPIATPMGGQVTWAGPNGPYGNLVVIENRGVQVWLAHNKAVLVQVGDIVEAGEVVALSGNTGMSTGPHLHFEVRRLREDGKVEAVDPHALFLPGQDAYCYWYGLVSHPEHNAACVP